MATSTTKNSTLAPDLDAATERVREANERFAQAGRKLTNAYLDGVERYASGVSKFERKLGEQAQVEPVASFLSAHAQLTDDLTKASVSAARELIAQ
jgi:hypothetical protein